MWTTLLLVFLSIVLGAAAWLLFVWAVKSDQFDDLEGQKHRILDDEEGSRSVSPPPPGNTEGNGEV